MTDITTTIRRYRVGEIDREELVRQLGDRDYPLPNRLRKELGPPDPVRREDWLDAQDYSQAGTWDEITKARNTGLLTAADYAAISAAHLARSR